MLTDKDFLALLQRMEDETLDFKERAYRLSNDLEKAEFIKDVLCMVNTPREHASFIILGVRKHSDGSYDLVGLDSYPDEANLESQLTDRVNPIPQFTYDIIMYQGLKFGIISFPPQRIGPVLPVKDFPGATDGRSHTILRRGQIYLRRGSKNDAAMTSEDIARVVRWVEGKTYDINSTPLNVGWEEFLEATHTFEFSRRYLLLVPPLNTQGIEFLTVLSELPWSLVVDFDPESDISGFQKVIGPMLESHRNVHRVVLRERPILHVDRSTYWFYARGLSGRTETMSTGIWREWQKQYGAEMREQFGRFTAASSPAPVTLIALWYTGELISHLRTVLNDALAAMQDAVNLVILTDNPATLRAVADENGATLLDIPLHQLCAGLHSQFLHTSLGDQAVFELPSSSGAPIVLETKTLQWLEEEFELVHLSKGAAPILSRANDPIGHEFLRGGEIDWYELSVHVDVDRDKTDTLRHELEQSLIRKRAVRINLYHDPGAGGTTVARRILWDLHREFPTVILHHCMPSETAERFFRVASLSGLAVLVLIDGADVADRQIDELYSLLRSRLIPVVLFQTLRRFEQQSEGKRARHLSAQLSPYEARRFVDAFSREKPLKRAQLERLAKTHDGNTCTAFYFGLETFGKDFLGLEPYVHSRLTELTDIQRKIITFLALSHHYAQLPIQAQAFAMLINFPKNRVLKLAQAIPERTRDLLVELQEGIWRTAHDVIAQEILEQVLWPSGPERRLWRQNLSSWAKEFASFCRGESAIPSEDLKEIVNRTFIYRDNTDLLGTERSANRTFAQLIDEIPSSEGRVELLRFVADLYPDEAHLWAHLGRLYAVELKDYSQALIYIDRAIGLQSNDHVLFHMKGMALRYQSDDLMRQGVELEKIMVYVKHASQAFEEARVLDPDDPYGYISEVQMLARALDYAGRHYTGGLQSYWVSSSADTFLRDSLERAENLLEQVRRNREGEGASSYEEDCRGKLDVLYGRHEHALQIWDSLLNRKDAFHPPLRRQIVWTYLARRGRSWDALEAREVERIVGLLERNLQEEPKSDMNLRLWVQAVRRLRHAPSIEAVIERVSYWKINSGTLEAIYYLYVFNVLQVLEGSVFAREDAKRYIDECRHVARYRRNRTKSLEWLGMDKGINRLVYHSELGRWLIDKDFWEKTQQLARIQGRISRIDGPQAGLIEIEGGLHAFFVPARGEYSAGRSENQLVDFYLGFSYDGLRAWEVKDAN